MRGHNWGHLRHTHDGLEYRVADQDGERHDIDLEQEVRNCSRLDDAIEAITVS